MAIHLAGYDLESEIFGFALLCLVRKIKLWSKEMLIYKQIYLPIYKTQKIYQIMCYEQRSLVWVNPDYILM